MGKGQEPQVLMRRRSAIFFALLAIVVIGSALRFYKLASLSLWYDEATIIRISAQVDRELTFIRADLNADPPLFLVLVRFWYSLVRAIPRVPEMSVLRDFLMRLPVCLMGIVGIPLTFITSRSILKENEAALIAALLFAISPFQIYYAQEFRAYSFYVVLSLGALYCLVKALDEDRPRYWVGLVLFLAASLYLQFFAVWNIAMVNLYFALTFNTHRRLLRKWLISQLILALLCVPGLLLILRVNRLFEQAGEHFLPRPNIRTGLIIFKTFFSGYSPNYLVYRAITFVSAAFVLLGLYSLRARWRTFILLVVMAFVPIAANLVASHIRSNPYCTHRVMIFSAIPCYMLVAIGMRAVAKRALTLIAVAVLASLTVPCLADHYMQRLHPAWTHRAGARYKAASREAARYIAQRLVDGDFVGHSSHYTLGPFCYYLPVEQQRTLGFTDEEREGMIRGFPNERMWEWTGFLPVRIESVTRTAKRLWLVQSWWETPFELDPLSKQLVGWLDGHCLRMERKPFDGLTVHLYNNDPELKAATETIQLMDYGNRVVPYYLFPKDEDGLTAGRAWRKRFLATLPSSLDEQPRLYGVQFNLAVVEAGELSLQGRKLRADFLDEDVDGKPEALRLADVGGLIAEQDTTRIDSVDYSLLAMDGDGTQAVLASFPLRASTDFNYQFIVRNVSDVDRTIRCRVYESDTVIGPLSFSRCDPQSDTWRPTLQYNFRPPPVWFNKFAMVARFSDKRRGGEAIYKDIRLDAGRYVVFARVLQEALKTNQSRANARFTVTSPQSGCPTAPGQLIGTVEGNNPAGSTGWTWRTVGDFQADGQPARLVIAAYNDDRLPQAYFDIDRVMFVRAVDDAQPSPLEPKRFDITLLPFEEKRYTLSASLGTFPSKRIDIELLDTESNEFRNIFFRVRRAS